jgi:hypothetical protein
VPDGWASIDIDFERAPTINSIVITPASDWLVAASIDIDVNADDFSGSPPGNLDVIARFTELAGPVVTEQVLAWMAGPGVYSGTLDTPTMTGTYYLEIDVSDLAGSRTLASRQVEIVS